MSGDISTQSPNLDKIILRNVVVIVVVVVVVALEAMEWDDVRLQPLTQGVLASLADRY